VFRKRRLDRGVMLVLLALVASACAAHGPATGTGSPGSTAEESAFADPFAYCAAVGTVDTPDERYVGVPVPEVIIEGIREQAEIAEDAPDDWVAGGTVWRCMDGDVWACFAGANLPCSEKADTSTTPKAEVEGFCRDNPDAETVPAAVTGRATIYEWHCVEGTPQVGRELFEPDSQGFISEFWYELSAP